MHMRKYTYICIYIHIHVYSILRMKEEDCIRKKQYPHKSSLAACRQAAGGMEAANGCSVFSTTNP